GDWSKADCSGEWLMGEWLMGEWLMGDRSAPAARVQASLQRRASGGLAAPRTGLGDEYRVLSLHIRRRAHRAPSARDRRRARRARSARDRQRADRAPSAFDRRREHRALSPRDSPRQCGAGVWPPLATHDRRPGIGLDAIRIVDATRPLSDHLE